MGHIALHYRVLERFPQTLRDALVQQSFRCGRLTASLLTSSFTGALRSQKLIISIIRDGKRWGMREVIYLSLHCHHHSDSCIKMDSDESHFNISVSLSKRYRTEVLPLTNLTPYR